MKQLSINKNSIRALSYDLIGAYNNSVHKHPQKDMEELGINIIAWIPQTIADCIHVLTNYQGNLPDYISEIEINLEYWNHYLHDIEVIE